MCYSKPLNLKPMIRLIVNLDPIAYANIPYLYIHSFFIEIVLFSLSTHQILEYASILYKGIYWNLIVATAIMGKALNLHTFKHVNKTWVNNHNVLGEF